MKTVFKILGQGDDSVHLGEDVARERREVGSTVPTKQRTVWWAGEGTGKKKEFVGETLQGEAGPFVR